MPTQSMPFSRRRFIPTPLSRAVGVAAAIAVGSYASASFAGHHFYTADPGEARLVQTQGHVPEGQLGCVYLPDKGPAEAVKFYRLYDPNNGDHLYTIHADEKNNAMHHG